MVEKLGIIMVKIVVTIVRLSAAARNKKPAGACAPAGFVYSLTGESLLISNRDRERAGI
jgi:hypothetical protein